MARYIGPKTKIARKFGAAIYGSDKNFERRKNQPPGQHGPNKRRGAKKSEYAVQLAEKQKAKYTYGILERQFANLYDKAQRSKGVTGEVLLQLCESRLDNVVYRFGFAKTRAAARQLVSHRHITVNGELVNIPSFLLKPGDVVAVREKSSLWKWWQMHSLQKQIMSGYSSMTRKKKEHLSVLRKEFRFLKISRKT